MRYTKKMTSICWVLIVCLIVVGSENAHAQSKSKITSAEDSNNRRLTSEKGEPIKGTEVLKLKVGYIPATHDALLFIAKEEQFFEQYYLSVTISSYINSPKALEALGSEEIDIAIPGIAAPLYKIASGASLRIIGGEAWYSAGIVAKRDLMPKEGAKGKALLEPFKGKRIATIMQSTGDAILRGKIKEFGLDGEIDIRIYLDPKRAKNALMNGEVDAAMLWSPYMSQAEHEDDEMSVVVWAYQLQKHPCCRQVIMAQTQNNKREALVRYMSGIVEAKNFMSLRKNNKIVLEHVKKYVIGIDDEILKEELFNDPPLHKKRTKVFPNNSKELFNDPPKRTEVSPNNSPEEIYAYAKMMEKATLIAPQSVTRIEKSVDTDILAEAYQRVYEYMPKKIADKCAKKGLMPDREIRKLAAKYKKQESKRSSKNFDQ